MLSSDLIFKAVDLHKRGKESKQPIYRRLIHTPLDVENIQEVKTNKQIKKDLPSVLVCSYVYFPVPLQNISDGKYKSFEEFRADAQLIVHNTAILHGGEVYKLIYE